MHIGLVIQGPLVSYGKKSGENAHVPWRRIPEEQTVRYDCRENITSIIRDFGRFFDSIVISTWQDEIQPGDSWEGAVLIASDDRALPKSWRGEVRGQKIPHNRFRQMFGVLTGIEYLEKHSNVDMVLKIRTDQYVDLAKMLEFITTAQSLKRFASDVIFVPSIMREDAKYGILDFYFAGSISAMKAFHHSIFECKAFEFEPSIHRELWLKYAYVAYRNAIGAPEYAYFPSAYQKSYCDETLQIFHHMMFRVFWPLEFSVFRTVIWRGRPWSEEALAFECKNNIFAEEVAENATTALSGGCPRFLGIDWRRYADFRLRILKRPFSIRERACLYQNIFLQFFFRFFARFGYFVVHPTVGLVRGKRRISRLLGS
ncbi:MAG: WavE lipopolysaccharide synthesis family protein [Candidatus Yanofskybacteria bacterium]|nr:WavE lipopolysaccharide synthesis family protein [Candidatus Yanofskybacteria bacterium]